MKITDFVENNQKQILIQIIDVTKNILHQNKFIEKNRLDLNAHINELTSQFEELNQENKDLLVNNQLEDIQTNLNEFRHQQTLEKKEVSHTQ